MKQLKRLACSVFAIFLLVSFVPAQSFAKNATDNPSSYAYEETDASSVTVDVTVSSDGVPLLGNDDNQTVLSNLEVTVPWFDLTPYGLQDFNRYTTDESGSYSGSMDTPIKRPTALHLYIYLLEHYYLDLPESACYKGNLDGRKEVFNMQGETAYDTTGKSALQHSGSATSFYMVNFWGHDENLMYYRNHRFPLMREGWGSTADYILLSDGDKIDLAMFTNWNFWTAGSFVCFDSDNYLKTEDSGDFEIYTLETATSAGLDGSGSGLQGYDDAGEVTIYDSNWNSVGMATAVGASTVEGFDLEAQHYSINTDSLEPGTYHIVGLIGLVGGNDAKNAPATATLIIEPKDKHTHSLVCHEACTVDCGHNGHPQYWVCSLCNKVFLDAQATQQTTLDAISTPATGDHHWGMYQTTELPQCNKDGVKTSVCKICGQKRYQKISAPGHDYSSGTWNWADDLSSASITLNCATESVHPHKTLDAQVTRAVTKQPTCTTPGEITYTATVEAGSYDSGDGYSGHWPTLTSTKTVEIPATGIHQWSAYKTVVAPTLLKAGVAQRVCANGGEVQTMTLARLAPKMGMTFSLNGGNYKIISTAKRTVCYMGPTSKKRKTATVPAKVMLQGVSYSVVGIGASAFKGSATVKVVVKTAMLKKASVRGCLKGSKVKTVKVPKAKRKAYRKIFTKKCCGKKVNVQ